MGKIIDFNELCNVVSGLKSEGKKVVLTHGVFDLLHRGHITLLLEAKKHGDILVVGVDCNDNARTLKGPGRPINSHEVRMFMVAAFEPVDYVFLISRYEGPNNLFDFFVKLYSRLKPDILATCIKCGEWGRFKKRHAEAAGIEFVDIDHQFSGERTTDIIKKIKEIPG